MDNSQIEKKLGIPVMLPQEGNYQLHGVINPLQKRTYKSNPAYEKNVERMIGYANQGRSIVDQPGTEVEANGQKILRLFNTANNREGQLQVDKFKELKKANEYFTYDIETLGDAMGKTNFSVSEIAIQGYTKQNGQFVRSNKSVTQLIKPTQIQTEAQQLIQKLRRDRYHFNQLTDWQQRTMVDLMRYSTLSADGAEAALFTMDQSGKRVVDLKHNSVVHGLFDKTESLVNSRVVANMNSMLNHMESGLKNLNQYGMEQQEAIYEYKGFLESNQNAHFVSYNGDSFDLPTLKDWGAKAGVTIQDPKKHLDYMRVIQTVYPSAVHLHNALGRDEKINPFQTGMNRLQEFRKTLGFNTAAAHSALHDIGDEGLGGVINKSLNVVNEKIKSSKTDINSGFAYHPTQFSWNDQSLKVGQQLFAVGGVQAYQDGELSFGAQWNPETNAYDLTSSSFNNTVVNSKTFYTVQGLMDFSDEQTKRYALRLYDSIEERYSFIVREGDNALDQIGSFVQGRFYNWDGASDSIKKDIKDLHTTDLARRRYQKLFSLEKAGTGQTGGLEAARRLYSNASILEQRLMGKSKNLTDAEYERIPHYEMMEKLSGNFNSMWDPETKTWVHNQAEQEQFFKMGRRLISERPIYEKAIAHIDAAFQEELDAAGSYKEQQLVRQKKDMAWYLYNRNLEGYLEKQGHSYPTELVDIKEFENRRLSFRDYKTDNSHSINMESLESTRKDINRFVYASEIKNSNVSPRQREDRYRERVSRMIRNMATDGVIDGEMANNLMEINKSNEKVHNTITLITNELMQGNLKFNETREQVSLAQNKALSYVTDDINFLHMNSAVESARNVHSMVLNPRQAPGSRMEFSSTLEATLNRLDQKHLSGINPNNRAALEHVLASFQEDERFKGYNYALSFDERSANAKISIFKAEHSTSVVEHLAQGKSHSKALNLVVPLVNESGVHVVGNRRLNARTVGFMNGDEVNFKSSTQAIAENYVSNMKRIMNAVKEGDYEVANKRARQTLNDSVEKLAGIQRNMGFSDSYYWNNNQSDFFKQGQVDIQSVMIEDWYKQGKLLQEDFYSDAFDQNGAIRNGLTFDDLKAKPVNRMLLSMGAWAEEKNLNLFSSSNKADHVANGRLNMQDIRDYMPFGHYTFQGRDNAVQYMNAHSLSEEVMSSLEEISNKSGIYINKNDLIMTDKQRAYQNQVGGDRVGYNTKVAFMNDQDLLDRLQEISKTERGQKLLQKENIMNADGTWNQEAIPRIYEQQGLVVDQVQDALKVSNQKFLSTGSDYELYKKSHVKPGDIIGHEMINGKKKLLRYEGTESGMIFEENGRLGVKWEEQGFKNFTEGEKSTNFSVSHQLMQEITGNKEVSMVLNPNMAKHMDYGMYLSGKGKLLADFVNTTKNKKKRKQAIRMAENVGLMWDESGGMFMERANGDIAAGAMEEIFNEVGIKHHTKHGYEMSILENRVAKVSNYSTMVDETGRKVLKVWHDQKGNLQKVYGTELAGVNWGHREMGVLQDLGLTKTYEATYDAMMAQATDSGNFAYYQRMDGNYRPKDINRLDEYKNLLASLDSFNQSNDRPGLNLEHFRSLPELDTSHASYEKTIFDHKYVKDLLGDEGSKHGYWFELPGVEQTNNEMKNVAVNISGDGGARQQINKIFVPFTNLEGADGDVHLREIQKHISDIFRKAADVEQSPSETRGDAVNKLQGAVERYINRLSFDVTSSKGHAGDMFKATLSSSGSGLFKLLDPSVSQKLDGEYTFISEHDAKAMGVYEKLSKGEELFTMNVRYPTFHSNAMQVSKLRIGENVAKGEFHTTSFMSSLMKADSDGDYDNIVVMDTPEVQQEWKQLYEKRESSLEEAYRKHVEKDSTAGRGFASGDITKEESFLRYGPNTQAELAAKIGKRTIGKASNLNLYMRQLAIDHLEYGDERQEAIKMFGQDLEQKLISSKHINPNAPDGLLSLEAPAHEMIDAVYKGDWNTVRRIDADSYANEFSKGGYLDKAIEGLSEVTSKVNSGLYADILKFGTSRGLDVDKLGTKKVMELVYGLAAPGDTVLTNSHLNLIQKSLGVEVNQSYTDLEGNEHYRVDPYRSIEEQLRTERTGGFSGAAGEFANDLTGGVEPRLGEKVSDMFQKVSENKNLKRGLIGGALALGGLAGYNILSEKEPLAPPPTANQPEPKPAIAPLSNTLQSNANVQVRAKGNGHTSEQFSQMVNAGMQQSNMNNGGAKVTVHHQDNTQKLNRVWYRDKVQENI
jgi:hypothetical protein